MFKKSFAIPLIVVLALLMSLVVVSAQDDIPDAEIENDEGGVAVLTGEINYTVGFLSDFGEPAVVVSLTDLSNYVDTRGLDPDYVVPEDGQLIGRVTSDPLVSPFSYSINLPIVPTGELRDVDNDSDADTGVVIFQVQVFVNMLGNVYWDQNREYGTGFNSTYIPPDFNLRNEIQGGTLLVWSPDGNQGFPSGFGDDGLLFTEDDPIVRLPQGYTVVSLDGDSFSFDRTFEATVDLIEAEQSLQPADYSEMSYTEAFDALIEQMRREYSFTEYKGIDWDALYEEFAPRFAEAEETGDAVAYQFALLDFTWAIPDGHVGANLPLTNDAFVAETDGSLGVAIRELDDGRVIVNYLVADSPAAEAGFDLGTEIIALDGVPIADAISASQPWSAPFSTEHSLRLQQMRYVTRFELGVDVEVTYRNPGDEEDQTVTLTTVAERESWTFSSFTNGQAPAGALPLEFEILDSGFGYIRINRFSGDPLMLLRLWEWSIDTLNAQGIEGLIIDLRWNGGGYNIYNQMVSMLFDEEVVVGNSADFYPDVGEFVVDPLGEETIEPSPDGRYYGGDVAVIVSPFCASACEFFGYELTLNDRSTVVGFHPSSGLGGNITPVFMPDGVYFQFTMGRSLDADGEIRFEGIGIEPDVVVPVTEETLFYEGDILLDTAVDFLTGATTTETSAGGEISLGDTVEGSFDAGERVQYEFTATEEVTVSFLVSNDDGTQFSQRIYVVGNEDPAIAVDANDLEGIDIPADLPLILEIGAVGDDEGASFTFSVVEFVPPEVTVEDAGAIAVGDSVDGELVTGLRLQYTLEVAEDGVIDIAVTDETGGLDTYLRVYVDGAEEATFENDDMDGSVNSLLAGVEVTAGQTLVIEVAGFNDSSEGTYTLSVTASE